MSPVRPIFADIDLAALAANTSKLRRTIGPDIRFYGVCKGDAYGVGLEAAAPVIIEAGADALATAEPADIAVIRRAGIMSPILLYPSTPPDVAGELAELGATVSVHDTESLGAFARQGRPVEAYVKVDCGFGRLGLCSHEWPSAFTALRRAGNIHLVGVYTHLGQTDNAAAVEVQMQQFERAVEQLQEAGFSNFERMVASSRVVIGFDHLHLNAVNPGRALYGLLEPPWTERFRPQPVIRRITTRVLQTKLLPKGSRPGYLDGEALSRDLPIAVLAAGFSNGLPRIANDMPVLVRGRPAPALGLRSTEHMVVDISAVPEAVAGDEAVVIGLDGDVEISAEQFAETSALPLIEILPRITRGAVRRYDPAPSPQERRRKGHEPANYSDKP